MNAASLRGDFDGCGFFLGSAGLSLDLSGLTGSAAAPLGDPRLGVLGLLPGAPFFPIEACSEGNCSVSLESVGSFDKFDMFRNQN